MKKSKNISKRIPYKPNCDSEFPGDFSHVRNQEKAIDHALGKHKAAIREANSLRALLDNKLVPIEALQILSASLALGVFPRWEVLAAVNRGWLAYVDGKDEKLAGTLSLGDAFAGAGCKEPSKQARKKAARDAVMRDLFHLIENFRDQEKLTLDEAIERTILSRSLLATEFYPMGKKLLEKDSDELLKKVDSLRRAYRDKNAGTEVAKIERRNIAGHSTDELNHLRDLLGLARPTPRKND